MIAEPDVALTDFGLAVESTVLALLTRRTAPGPRGRSFALLFAGAAAAAALGGAVHGFPACGRTAAVLWRPALVALGVSTLAAWRAGARLLWLSDRARVAGRAATAAFAAYAACVALVTDRFEVAIVNALPAALFLAVALAAARRRGDRGAGLALLGVLTMLLGMAAQWQRIGVPALALSSNAVYHVIEGGALLLLFGGACALERGPDRC